MEIKKIDTGHTVDLIKLIEIFNDVFENKHKIPSKPYLKKLLSNPDFLVFVAKENNKVVGGLTIYILHQYYTEKPLAYIYDVGVTPDFQGQGIGKSLISYTCNYCKKNGFEEAYVEAENKDTDAINFYRKTNSSNQMQAIHFTYSF